MKSSPATRSRRLKSSLLLGVCSFWGLGTAFPAFSQEEEGADRSQLPIPRESRPVHSRSAETARNASTAEQGDSQSGQGGQPSSLTLKAGASYTVPRGTAMKSESHLGGAFQRYASLAKGSGGQSRARQDQ